MEITQSSNLNRWKWTLVFCLLTAVIIGNYLCRTVVLSVRVPSILIVISIALLVAWRTSQGRRLVCFVKEAKIEAQGVIWPKRQVTARFTFAIVLMTMVAALVLWGVDTVLVLMISYLTGLRG